MRKLLSLKWRLLPLALLPIILALPIITSRLNRHQVSKTAQAAEVKLNESAPKVVRGIPNRIVIPSLAIDLPVVSQSYSPAINSWPVDANDANYAAETPQANNVKGQPMIYGHDNRRIFGPLLSMPKGTVVYVYTSNDHIFKYSYVSSKDVDPSNVDVVKAMSKGPAGLKLITCTGAYFQYRHLMTFKLLDVS